MRPVRRTVRTRSSASSTVVVMGLAQITPMPRTRNALEMACELASGVTMVPSATPSGGLAAAGAVLRVLEAALPLEHCPAGIVVLGQFREDRLEVHLTVARGTEPAGAIDPRLEPAIHALAAGRIELGILDVKHADAVVIEVDVLEIVELLQYEVTGIIQQVAALVTAHALEEHLERHAVVQILAGMDLEAGVDTVFIEDVENRAPAPRQLVERRLDETGWPLRPGVEIRPR